MAPITKNACTLGKGLHSVAQPGAGASPASSSRQVLWRLPPHRHCQHARGTLCMQVTSDCLTGHFLNSGSLHRLWGLSKYKQQEAGKGLGVGLCSAGIFSGRLGCVDTGSLWWDWIKNQATDKPQCWLSFLPQKRFHPAGGARPTASQFEGQGGRSCWKPLSAEGPRTLILSSSVSAGDEWAVIWSHFVDEETGRHQHCP